MAVEITRDVVVDSDEWNAILKQLEAKDQAVKEMFDQFIKALELLVNDGFIQGTRHDNMKIFLEEVKKIRAKLDGVYDSAKSTINTLTSEADSADKYTPLSPDSAVVKMGLV